MSKLTASARPIPGTLRHQIDVNGRHMITTDEPETLGGTDAAPAPHELLPAMVASCASTMIVLYAQRHGWRLDDVEVEVAYHTKETPRRIELTVHLPDGLTDEQVERLRRVAATCPVKRAFEAGFTFEQRLALDVPAADSGRRGELRSRLRPHTDVPRSRRRDAVGHDR